MVTLKLLEGMEIEAFPLYDMKHYKWGDESINTNLCGKKLNLLAFILFTHIDVFLTSEPANGGFAKTADSVCISVPLWQIRIFGLFFTPNPDIRILSEFFCAGPYRSLYTV